MSTLGALASGLAADAEEQGYSSLAASAREIGDQARQWNTVCAVSRPSTPERVECVSDTYGVTLHGERDLLASLYEAVQS